ncbi:uncharacterized protein LOC142339252 isoform X2 [Convolutriloba macropyga]|uniref:uncharacterized protein LOC142339252 isoform X2 n=1 Tax=Convolutriloba macropyga TaxID=536237 RepID=UPI003F51B87F
MFNTASQHNSSAFTPFAGGSGGGRSIWGNSGSGSGGGGSGGGGGHHQSQQSSHHGPQWGPPNNSSNMGRGGNNGRQMGGWDRSMNSGSGNQSNRFNPVPGSAPRPIGAAWGSESGGPPSQGGNGGGYSQSGGGNSSSQSKVNPSNIWNIPGMGGESNSSETPSSGNVRPMPSQTPVSTISQGQSGSATGNSDSQGDSFTNIGIWEPTETKDKDPDSDPKGTRLWAVFLQSRGHPEDKNMGGKLKIPSFQSVEEMSDSEKRMLLERLINCHEGWGKMTVNQETLWDETMNVFNRSESISSDKTHSDNPESPTLNDPSSFPVMSKSVNNSAVSLVSPTSKAGDGWGSPQSNEMRSVMGGGMNRNNSGQLAADDGGTSAWGKQSAGPAWNSPQGYESSLTQPMHSNSAPGSALLAPHLQSGNGQNQLQPNAPVSVSVGGGSQQQQSQPSVGGLGGGNPMPSPNAWEKPLNSPSSVIGAAPGSNPSNDKVANGANNATNVSNNANGNGNGQMGGVGGSGAWPLDTAAAAGEIAAAITTAPLPTLPSSSSAVWSKSADNGGSGDSWGDSSVSRGLSSDMWNLDNSDKGSLISESAIRGPPAPGAGSAGGNVVTSQQQQQQQQPSHHSSRVPSPSPLDAVNDELFKVNSAMQNSSMSKLPTTLSGSQGAQMMGGSSSLSQQSGAGQSMSHQRPTNLGPNLGGFPPADSPGPNLDFVSAGILDQDTNVGSQLSSSLFPNSGATNPAAAGKYSQQQQQHYLGSQGNRGAAPCSNMMMNAGATGANSSSGNISMMMQQHQKANALKQQQQMHHLELAYKAGLLPRSTDMRIFTYGIETTQTAQYRDYLQKYAQTKFALQKLRAQFPYKNNQVQQNPRNHSMIAAFNEHIQSMKSYDNNLNTLEQICNKLFIDVQSQTAAMQMHSPQQPTQQSSSHLGAADIMGTSGMGGLFGGSGLQGNSASGASSNGSRLGQWMTPGSGGSNPGSAGLDDNVFDLGAQGPFNGGMSFGGGNGGGKSVVGEKGSKMMSGGGGSSSAFPEFVPGQIWQGGKDYANDPEATPASVHPWQSAVNERDVMNLQENLSRSLALGGTGNGSGGGAGGMGGFMGMKSPASNWNSGASSGAAFDMGGSSDMWRQQSTRMSTGSGASNKPWNSGPYGAPGLGAQASIGGGPSGNSAKWQHSLRNQSMSSTGAGGYGGSFGPPSTMSPQRPNMGGASQFGGHGYRGSANQNMMGSSWNYPGNNLMGGGASSGGGAFDPTAALGMMSFGGSLGGGQSGDLSSADQGNGGAGGM